MAALLGLARAAGASILLVLPAGLDPAEAAETARAFLALGARHLLPTRLDAARRLGGVLAGAGGGTRPDGGGHRAGPRRGSGTGRSRLVAGARCAPCILRRWHDAGSRGCRDATEGKLTARERIAYHLIMMMKR